MSNTISVCVPACNRPELLREALLSCLAQTRRPDCILVGDDSKDDASEKVVREVEQQSGFAIDYQRNTPPLRQNANTNSLLLRAKTSHLMLLHDDDLLLPNAIEDLMACWEEYPHLTAAYGKQYSISHEGVIDELATEKLNSWFLRTDEYARLQKNDYVAGICQQLHNDGYVMRTEAAQAVLWRPQPECGDAGDYDFGLRLCINYRGFYFLNRFTAKYRNTATGSISTQGSNDAAFSIFKILTQTQLPLGCEELRARQLSGLVPAAMMQAMWCGQIGQAWQIYLSPYFGRGRRMSLDNLRWLVKLTLKTIKLTLRPSKT